MEDKTEVGFLGWLRGKSEPRAADSAEAARREARVAPASPEIAAVDRYGDLGLLGRGGMAQVRSTYDRSLLRSVAMKLLDPQLAADQRESERFVEEAQITGQLEHPNIPAIHDLGIDRDGTRFFTMTQVRGQTLEQLLRHNVDLSDERQLFSVLHLFIKVCEAMAFAHSRGVIHCDLKPPNIMVGDHGEVYVMDWGLARLKAAARPSGAEERVELRRNERHLDEGKLFGSLAYMPPEQARGMSEAVDERSDIFALGGILYRILVGHAPWVGHSEEAVVALIKTGRFVPPQKAVAAGVVLPPQLCAVACRAMSADPADRYQSVEALKDDVELYLSGSGRTPMHAFRAGQLIVREGDTGRSAFVIEKGSCRAFKTTGGKREALREMGAGEIFGEMALLTEGPRTASVEAVGAVTVRELTADALTQEMGQTFFVGRLLKVLAERFHDADARASALAHERDAAKVREVALTHLVFGQRVGDGASARWKPLRDELKFRFGLREPEALALVGQIPGVCVDAKKDEVVCAAMPAPPLAIDELG